MASQYGWFSATGGETRVLGRRFNRLALVRSCEGLHSAAGCLVCPAAIFILRGGIRCCSDGPDGHVHDPSPALVLPVRSGKLASVRWRAVELVDLTAWQMLCCGSTSGARTLIEEPVHEDDRPSVGE